MTTQEAKQNIAKLVEKYEKLVDARKVKSYNEAQTRNEFIEPLFEFLGWDMRNLENPGEVTTEENVSKGRVDLAFRLNHIPVMFLEAKALRVDLDEWKWAEQAINYSWNKSVTWAILTDFEGIKVFNAEIPPKSLSQNLFFELKWHEYLDRFEQLRSWILQDFEIQRILDLSDIKVFKAASVQTCVIVIKKKKPYKTHKILINRPRYIAEIDNKKKTTNILQSSFLKMPQNMIRTDINEEASIVIKKIEENSLKMSDICYVVIGSVPHDSKTGASKDRLITTSKTKETHKKYLEGKDVGRYKINWRKIYLDYLPSQMHRPKFPELFENKKLIVRNISTKEGLLAVFDDKKYYTNDTVSLCVPWYLLKNIEKRNIKIDEKDLEMSQRFNMKYLLCLINSKLLNFYFKKVLSSNLHVYPEAIRNLPIYDAKKTEQAEISKLAQLMLDLQKELRELKNNTDKHARLKTEIEKLDVKIDQAIYKLYDLTDEEIKIIEK